MPSFNAKGSSGSQQESQPPQRTTFRPPWVKEGPSPLPMPTAPWIKRQDTHPEKQNLKGPTPVKAPPVKQISTENGKPIRKDEGKKDADKGPPVRQESKERVIQIKVEPEPTKQPLATKEKPPLIEKPKRRTMEPEKTEATKLPPAPPLPPPPPPIPGALPPMPPKPVNAEKAAKIEALRSRPRRRPDWTDMMKEVENGKKLKHVHCNDRSAPVIPKAKAKGQFVYESEQENVHNQLLKQIQTGVRLKRVKTNDRSRPILEGLRKFRRQMTIEEQIQKSASVADVVAAAAEPDELDDIDKVRDDLQSTKQMLALELRNKEALERENKRLMARLLNLEVELDKEKATQNILKEKGNVDETRTEEDDTLIMKLKEEATESAKMAKEMEDMYHKTAEELDVTRAKLESAWLRNSQLEMDLKTLETHGIVPITKQPSKKLISSISNAKPHSEPSSEEVTEEEETETETDEEDVAQSAAQQEKRVMRELKLLAAKLRTLKEKRAMAIKEKNNLKEHFSKLHKHLREEKKKYKELQREVDKMANLMKDVDDEDGENEGEEDEEEYEEETESESESEESEGGESEGDLPESASNENKITNLNRRLKLYETRLTTLKKSNYLLKANIDRRQDDLNRQKEMSLTLQEDLNSVLAELG